MASEGFICGPNASFFIERWFHDCVYTPWEMLAFSIGLSSVLFWVVAQCPQLISNFLRGSADALSPWFLLQWLAGDTFNLLGCLLTGDQLATETVTASYFIFVDCIIITQYTYYQIRNRNKPLEIYCSDSDDSLHKPRFGYQNIVKEMADPVTKSLLNEVDKFQRGTPEVSKKNLHSLVCPQNISQFNPSGCGDGKSSDRNICQSNMQHSTPFGAETLQPVLSSNLAHCCLNRSNKSHWKCATKFSRRSQIQPSDLHSQINFKQQHALICEECCRLRRVVLEYGLECGPSTLSKNIGVHSPRVNDVRVPAKIACRKPLLPVGKAQLRAFLCLAGLIILGSSSWNSMLTPYAREINTGHGFAFSRKALNSFVENRKTLYSWRHGEDLAGSSLPSLDTSFIASSGRRLLSLNSSSLWWGREFGRFLGWVSAVLYLGSRISQLIKNKQRMSADGLSLGMVTCALLANVTYGVSILMRISSWEEFTGKAPWLVGSLGTVSLDLTLFIQAQYFKWYYKKRDTCEHTPLLA